MAVEPVSLDRLRLEEFRVYRNLDLAVSRAGLRIVGPNGSGKTSIIESLLLLSTTRSRKGVLDVDLIHHQSGIELATKPYTRVRGDVSLPSSNVRLDIFIEQTEGNTTRKLIRVGDASRRAADVVGLFPTVSFSPEDLDLVIGSPSVRRRFLDVLLSQVDREYIRHLSRYGRMISHRNSLLKSIAAGNGQRNELEFWDDQVVALGAYLTAARTIALHELAGQATKIFGDLATFDADLEILYKSGLEQPDEWWTSVVSRGDDTRAASQRIGVVLEAALKSSMLEDIARGVTTAGPHRDDLVINLDGLPIQRFGSRGQQRLAIVALKLAEIEFISARLGVRPALLLDDVLSELDSYHRDELLRRVCDNACQMFVTATDRDLAEHESIQNLDLITLTGPGIVDVE
ncbi:DNA replication/repair protein RecF [soil metagenome]